MNLEQFEEVEIRIFYLRKFLRLSLFAKYHFSQLEIQMFYLICKMMYFEVANRARPMSKTLVGFQLFICFVNYYELHCIQFHSRHHHVAILNLKGLYRKKSNRSLSLGHSKTSVQKNDTSSFLKFIRKWVIPEKIHTSPMEEISAIQRDRREQFVSDNSKCIYLGHPKWVGGLISNFLRGGGMDV